jgi:hypothetical protein
LQKAGIPHELVTIPGGGHGNFTHDQWQRAYAAIEKLLAGARAGVEAAVERCQVEQVGVSNIHGGKVRRPVGRPDFGLACLAHGIVDLRLPCQRTSCGQRCRLTVEDIDSRDEIL